MCFLHHLLVFGDDFLQRLGVEVGIELGFLLLLLAVEDFLERMLRNVEHDVAEHLDQAAIGVVGEARIVAALGQAFDALSFRPRLRMVSIMPGMENLAPERTLTSSGLSAGAELLSLQLFQAAERLVHLRDRLPSRRRCCACTRGRLRSEW